MRLVIDTNTVLALWMFGDPALAPLRQPCEDGRFVLLSNQDCLDELRRVLGYAEFKLSAASAQSLFQAYAARVTLVSRPSGTLAVLPRCKDRDDQKFLEVARDGQADALISRDKELLKLERRKLLARRFRILTPEKLAKELADAG